MEVEIISRQSIKPSSPTPPHLRTHKLSLLDQFIPANHVPIVLFYSMLDNDRVHVTSQLLKQSLSQVLTRFYTLAGKVRDALTIDCNDDGAFYVEARVKCNLSDFLTQPHLPSIGRFLAGEAIWNQDEKISEFHVTRIQVNIFDCGGIAIGALFSHMAVDGIAVSTFLKSWADTARGSCKEPSPSYIAPSLFLQNESVPKELNVGALLIPFLSTGKCITRRFVFNASAVANLKAKATSSCGQSQSPSRVQAVSSLIWKCFMASSKAKNPNAHKPFLLTHAVNIRKRALPPFSESCMGNFLWLAVTECKDENETELHQLAGQVKEAIAEVDADLVKQLQGDEGFVKYCESVKGIKKALHKEADFLGFTSWCNFGLYEVDFGWGKPRWVTPVGAGESSTSPYVKMVVLIETKSGDGMEAWVYLDEEEMDIFQCDRELQIYASVDQSPLSIGN